MMRKIVFTLIVALALLGGWGLFQRHPVYKLRLKTYFQNPSSLDAGALVCVDGVQVGTISSVRVHPEWREHPVEVLMALETPYKIDIPDDAMVSLQTQGVLGPTFVEIDTRNARGTPIRNDGVMKSLEVKPDTAADVLERVGQAMIQASKNVRPSGENHATPPQKVH
jgi:ABC-type transporter Mla subunit MlaD